jgi:hypothetical protein
MTKRFTGRAVASYLLASAALTAVVAQTLGQREQVRAVSVEEHAAGAGSWESHRDDAGKRDWQVQIERFDDNSIAGSIVVVGSPYLHRARLEGRVDAADVYGVIVGDDNTQVGTFTGKTSGSGVTGTYTTNQGDSGSWSWAGPAAAKSLKADETESDAASVGGSTAP